MKKLSGRAPSASMVVATVALVIALGGTSYAAFTLPKNSVGTKQLKNGAVTSTKLHNGAVTASKINFSGVTVPNANRANSAGSATNANHASSADSATNANHASSADSASNASHANTAESATQAAALPPLTYTTLTLLNGWTGAPFATRMPAVAVDAQGVVHFRGAMAQSGTFNPVAFTLPAQFRPSANVYIHIDMCNAASGRIQIQPTGTVDVQTGGGSTSTDAQCFTSLEGASYPLG